MIRLHFWTRKLSSKSFNCSSTTLKRFSSGDVVVDYFELLGLKRSYEISQDALKKVYKEKMMHLHPDKHTLKTLEEQEDAAKNASNMTRAYETIKDDYHRALYILQLEGNPMAENLSGDVLDKAFLAKIMDLREEVEDATGDDPRLKKLLEENKQRMNDTIEELHQAFRIKHLKEAMQLTAKLQYWNKIHETLMEKIKTVD